MSFFLKGVQDVDRIHGASDIDDTKRARSLADPDFAHAGSDRTHGFPVIRRLAALKLAQLKAGILPRVVRESPDRILAAADPDDWNHAHTMRNLAYLCKILHITHKEF